MSRDLLRISADRSITWRRTEFWRRTAEDLLILRGDSIELAYPFSTSPTPFVVRRGDGRERFTCCAIDALGIAPMLNEDVQIATRCHHCDAPLGLAVSPEGPSPDTHGVMVWVTRMRPDDGRACTGL